MRRWPALLLALAVAGCGGRPGGVYRQEPARDPGQCLAALAREPGVRFRRLPDTAPKSAPSPGCGLTGAVQLLDVQVPLRGVTAMSCPLASATIAWLRDSARPLARAILGSPLAAVETFGTYSCRPRNNVAGAPLSEHGTANALDVSGFRLADGRRVSVLAGWTGDDPQARLFLRRVRDGGCRQFRGVLSPDANAQHRDHLHFDMGEWRFCR